MALQKKLSELGLRASRGDDASITGLAVDSREVKEGYLFAALPGTQVHGGEFIQYALRMGAAAVLTDNEGALLAKAELDASDAVLVLTENPRQTLAYTSALWFGAQPDVMLAVTGTNGKTSVSTFARMIWQELGKRAINLGTTGVEGDWNAPLAHTTPEPITLHRTLSEAAHAGVSHAAMEASSHGLAQNRLDGVRLKAAGFTNFTQDHLDYHSTFDEYFAAKSGLFSRVLSEDGTAVINVDDARGPEMAAIAAARDIKVMAVGRTDGADIQLTAQRYHGTGQEVFFKHASKGYRADLKLIGGFQAENVLLAAGLVIACGEEPARVFETLDQMSTVRGRMQLAATRKNGASVFVDYSHTPDAVATALKAMRPHVAGRIIAIVGAGGDRDAGKRPLMGAAAAQNADVVIVTDDNPRSEDPASIREAVMQGCPEANNVGDRAEAILRGVDLLEPGDALLIAGKGHESGQIVGDDVLPFDDVEQASIAVAALEGRL
ncbi:UDP-N-acetylmuramoyl-L-alanyl-D-glutamate--2,6-diaminopimelate ligase [Lentibacter algarum]|uniref:UDP-N-acetylmuramoyl-L-alanyl-D-glutamate--2, 6-diaminopimelate ligase n=1 Tax=Lentibacter algarum TaxID=576131 RepID=UPI001C08BD37|nr:UDP-N-acetylmuramoyl-L-alanyl-D-glutamate--2,6-diaminopimelate ligase [Lentibacter algarum]MBU2983250.1 UDP-N-acetylmuramoyl-L-alanyl-D-glutamate--2,6-diaminopimelate ligase [Lentibacter algarum]